MNNRPSFFDELKRRNVLRAAAFYAASAWLLVQVATQVFPFFHIAEWVVRWIVVAATIGFPFAILFSWFYEWTPQGLQLESEIPPNESITRHTGKKLDRWRGRDAEALLDHILIRDPASARALYYKAVVRWRMKDAIAAATLTKRGIALGFPVGGLTLSSIAATKADYDRGAPDFASGMSSIGAKFSSGQLQTIYRGMYLGETERTAALNVVTARPNDQYVPTLLMMLSEPERSFAAFEQSSTGLSDAYLNFLWQPDAWSRKARQSAAFQGFAKRIGMVDYWKKNGWPDQCSATPGNDPNAFTCQ